jgi:hypothetical protein
MLANLAIGEPILWPSRMSIETLILQHVNIDSKSFQSESLLNQEDLLRYTLAGGNQLSSSNHFELNMEPTTFITTM